MRSVLTAAALTLALLPAPAPAQEPAPCRTVRLSDVGWTDVTSTTALFSVVIRRLGYVPQVTVLIRRARELKPGEPVRP